jgi:hypothetical protein
MVRPLRAGDFGPRMSHTSSLSQAGPGHSTPGRHQVTRFECRHAGSRCDRARRPRAPAAPPPPTSVTPSSGAGIRACTARSRRPCTPAEVPPEVRRSRIKRPACGRAPGGAVLGRTGQPRAQREPFATATSRGQSQALLTRQARVGAGGAISLHSSSRLHRRRPRPTTRRPTALRHSNEASSDKGSRWRSGDHHRG